jgi:hypothetical protein
MYSGRHVFGQHGILEHLGDRDEGTALGSRHQHNNRARTERPDASGAAMLLTTAGAASFTVALPDETATLRLMVDIVSTLEPGDMLTLSGDLGAGKTTFARAMIRYLAGDETIEVPSPTFTLMQTYDLPRFSGSASGSRTPNATCCRPTPRWPSCAPRRQPAPPSTSPPSASRSAASTRPASACCS